MKDISKIILTAFLSCTLLLGGTTAMAQTREAAANTADCEYCSEFFHGLCSRAESGTDAAVFVLERQRRFGTGEQL